MGRATYTAPNALLDRPAAGERRKWFRLVTPELDDAGTIFLPAGGRLQRFLANPVFCWMHPLDPDRKSTPTPADVIGKVVQHEQTAEHLDLLVEFAGHEMAQLCYEQVDGGFIRACSLDAEILRQEDQVIGGQRVPVITDWELYEASLVIVGSNPGALKLDRAAAACRAARTSSSANPPPAKRGSMEREELQQRLGLPGECADRKVASSALRRYMTTTADGAEDRARMQTAFEAHYPEGGGEEQRAAEEEKKDPPAEPEKKPEGEGEQRAAEDPDKDVDEMDEGEARAALRATRQALRHAVAGRAAAQVDDTKLIADVDGWIGEGRIPRDERNKYIELHRQGRARRTVQGIPAGTFTTAQRLGSRHVGTEISAEEAEELKQIRARRTAERKGVGGEGERPDPIAQAEKDAQEVLRKARAQAGRN